MLLFNLVQVNSGPMLQNLPLALRRVVSQHIAYMAVDVLGRNHPLSTVLLHGFTGHDRLYVTRSVLELIAEVSMRKLHHFIAGGIIMRFALGQCYNSLGFLECAREHIEKARLHWSRTYGERSCSGKTRPVVYI